MIKTPHTCFLVSKHKNMTPYKINDSTVHVSFYTRENLETFEFFKTKFDVE